MTWREETAAIIGHAVRYLSADAPLQERQRMVDAAWPHWGGCSWPRKAWQAARREYLIRYGYRPRTKERKRIEAEGVPLLEKGGRDGKVVDTGCTR